MNLGRELLAESRFATSLSPALSDPTYNTRCCSLRPYAVLYARCCAVVLSSLPGPSPPDPPSPTHACTSTSRSSALRLSSTSSIGVLIFCPSGGFSLGLAATSATGPSVSPSKSTGPKAFSAVHGSFLGDSLRGVVVGERLVVGDSQE